MKRVMRYITVEMERIQFLLIYNNSIPMKQYN